MSRTAHRLIVLLVCALVQAVTSSGARAQESGRSGGAALLIETAGASAGSGIALGVTLLALETDKCNNEDLGCIIERVGIAAVASAVGATAGDWIVGRRADTDPSLFGATIGSIAGVFAGFGIVHLISEELDLTREDPVLFVSYAVTHGFVTALGSRIVRWLRD